MRTSKYVLVVGSDATGLVFTSLLLQRFDYHICNANTAREALEMANAVVPALIITDLKPAGMTASQMIEVLRKNPLTAAVPVIFKLDQLTPEIEKKCREAGAAACVRKPVEPEELYRVVQSVIEPVPREHIRITTRMSLVMNNEPRACVTGECVTMLSSRGMYVRTRNPYPVKTKFPIRITLDNRNIAAEAKVIYSHTEFEGPFGEPGMGLYFSNIRPEDQERLQQYINDEVTSGLTPGKK